MTRSRATPRAGGKHPRVDPPSNMTSSASPMLNCIDLYLRTRPNPPKCNGCLGRPAGSLTTELVMSVWQDRMLYQCMPASLLLCYRSGRYSRQMQVRRVAFCTCGVANPRSIARAARERARPHADVRCPVAIE